MKLAGFLGGIARHAVIYGAGDLLGKLVGFFLIPLYTRALDPTEFGNLAVLQTFQTFGLMVLGLGQAGTLMRYYTLAEHEEERRRVVTGATLLVFGAVALSILAIAAGGGALTARFLARDDGVELLWILWAGVVARVCAEIPMTLLRLDERSHVFALANLARLTTVLGLVLWFVLAKGMGLRGIVIGEAMGAFVFAILLLPGYLRRAGATPGTRILLEYLRFGWPYVTSNLGAFALLSLDKLFLAAYGLVAMTGIYSLGGKFGTLINVVILSPFTLVWGPTMFRVVREHEAREAKRLFAGLLTWFSLVLFWAAVVLVLLARELLALVAPPSYGAAITVVPILVACFVLYGFYKHLQVGLSVTGKTRAIAAAFVAAALLNAVGNAVLIPRWGMLGAASATLAAYLLMVVIVGLRAHRAYPIQYEWRRIGVALAWAVALCLLGLGTETLAPLPRLAIKITLVLAYPAGLLLGGFLRQRERAELLGRLRALLAP